VQRGLLLDVVCVCVCRRLGREARRESASSSPKLSTTTAKGTQLSECASPFQAILCIRLRETERPQCSARATQYRVGIG
jgi:hypothetical protein